MVVETWFRSLWRTNNKHDNDTGKAVIGVLSFEVASLMSKLIDLWQSLGDKQVSKLREEMMASIGIRKLISEDDDYIVQLICAEFIYNLETVATSVARLGKKCTTPSLNGLEHIFNDLVKIGADQYGLEFTWKKMETKVRKMERLISSSSKLYQEMEILTELEQTLRRLYNTDTDTKTLHDYQKKIVSKRQEVRTMQENSLWNRTYDYAIDLLIRSIFTIFNRIKFVFGVDQIAEAAQTEHSGTIYSSNSLAALMQSSVHPSENTLPKFSSVPFWKVTPQTGPVWKTSHVYKSFSGPIGSPNVKPVQSFHSGPLTKTVAKSGSVQKRKVFGLTVWQSHSNTSTHKGKYIGDSPLINRSLENNSVHFKRKLLDPPPETLGAAALSTHYANIIIVIEKLAETPHLIGNDARDDLYSMLPSSIRTSLRSRLRPFSRTLASSVCDTALSDEWSKAMNRILEWLSPLAHNMIKWHSEQSHEQKNLGAREKVLLVQTLYYADQEKTESVIIELLVGLNYVWRFGREIEAKAFLDSNIKFEDYLNEDA